MYVYLYGSLTTNVQGADFPPANAATPTAGEIVLSANSADVYVSNRLTGNATDSIAHFRVNNVGGAAGISLSFVSTTSSLGSVPRMFSLSGPANANFPIAVRLNVVANAAAQDIVFVGNQRGAQGLVALARDRDTGIIGGVVDAAGGVGPLASVANAVFGGDNAGPQFVMEVPVPGVLGAKKRKARSFAERRRR